MNEQERLEELRSVLRSESISYGELAELQSLSAFIAEGDVELLEAAGVPEFPDSSVSYSKMTDEEARAAARKRLSVDGEREIAIVENDSRVVRLDDPNASGVAVEAWIYLIDKVGT